MTAPVESPYKFLDSYEIGDGDRFFGRDPEINILLADIVTARLVVLFARTGTGKTSLINAGVRPSLHDRGYETFYIRVEKDPVVSARAVIGADHPNLRSDARLSQQLRDLTKRLAQPVVLFFDQFEEFFLYVASRDPERARAFVAEIADVFDDEDSGVHVVFSMREEFFVELELFRDLIPSIYHADSNLRLKHFRPDQARAAIVEPARTVGVEVDQDVVEAIVRDLSQSRRSDDGDWVEPAQLQIVCDALWAGAADGRIDADDYREVGRHVDGDSIAHAILYSRVSKELEAIEDEHELDLVARLLPLLRTARQTKWMRSVAELTQLLGVDERRLRKVLESLAASRVIELIVRDQMDAVELTHDYLVQHLDALVTRVQAISPQRMLKQALVRHQLGEAQQALGVLAASTDVGIAATARRTLLDLLSEASGTDKVTPAALGVLEDIGTRESIEVLERISGSDDYVVSADARRVLQRLAQASNTDVAARAARALTESHASVTKGPRALEAVGGRSLELVAELVRSQQCILFLGAGVHAPPPEGSPFRYPPEQRPLFGAALGRELATEFDFAERLPGEDPGNLQRVALAYEITSSRTRLVEAITSAVDLGRAPSPMLYALARLDFPLVITTNYDQLFERALRDVGKQPRVAVYQPHSEPTTDFDNETAQSPIICKLHGDISRRESLVVTDEDYIQFVLRMSDREPYNPIPRSLTFFLKRWATLFVGYSLRDYNMRLLFKTLRWRVDQAKVPDAYVVEPYPDPLILDVWQSQRRYVRFLPADLWSFVPKLYEVVRGDELAP
jgi:hypothetical protein